MSIGGTLACLGIINQMSHSIQAPCSDALVHLDKGNDQMLKGHTFWEASLWHTACRCAGAHVQPQVCQDTNTLTCPQTKQGHLTAADKIGWCQRAVCGCH